MKERYNLNELAMITSLTTRTLRNYLRQGTLHGEKIDGAWSFTVDEVSAFLDEPAVCQAMRSRHSALVYDFMADAFKQTNRICAIMDYAVDDAESEAIMRFFCECMNDAADVELRCGRERGLTRVILSGGEDQVTGILRRYYSASASD